jgi:hypothetical protein
MAERGLPRRQYSGIRAKRHDPDAHSWISGPGREQRCCVGLSHCDPFGALFLQSVFQLASAWNYIGGLHGGLGSTNPRECSPRDRPLRQFSMSGIASRDRRLRVQYQWDGRPHPQTASARITSLRIQRSAAAGTSRHEQSTKKRGPLRAPSSTKSDVRMLVWLLPAGNDRLRMRLRFGRRNRGHSVARRHVAVEVVHQTRRDR